MKRLGLAIALAGGCASAHANLLLTAVFDGPLSGGVPKGVELYVLDDIADLSSYGLGSANNGGGSDGEEFSFPPISVSAGTYLYVASENDGFTAFFGFAPDFTSSAMSINGDDAIELFHNGTLFDLFGDPNADGTGTPWDYMDGWAYRATGSEPSAIFTTAQWSFSQPNALDGETANNAETLIPIGSFADGGTGCGDCSNEPVAAFISAIQGTPDTQTSNSYGETDVSPMLDTRVVVEAVVVGDFQDNDGDTKRNLSGFYIQEETADEDGNPASSEGVFVFDPDTTTDVNVGDRVKVVATVDQYFGETQLSSVESIEVVAQNQLDSVSAASVSLLSSDAVTLSGADRYQADLEAYEGMLVTLAEPVQIIEQFQLDRFNEIRVTAGDRPAQFSQLHTPDPAAYDAWLQQTAARGIVYDDGLNEQNAAIDMLAGFSPYAEATAPRMGDTAYGLTGVMDYKWAGNGSSQSTWRVRAHTDDANTFVATNPRPAAAPQVDGDLRVTSFNVLNLFKTLDNGASTALGHDPRGANNSEELTRQLQKTVNAIVSLDADVLGLVELENEFDPINDGSTAIEMLVNALNSRLGSNTFAYVYPGSRFVGSDAIAVGVIYKPAVVAIADGSAPAILDDTVAATLPIFADHDFVNDPLFDGPSTNRASLAVTFTHISGGDNFTVVVNHLKSKGSGDGLASDDPNADHTDGAGAWNQRRLDGARAVDAWLQTAPTDIADNDAIIMGDLNAYAAEAPLTFLLSNGYSNVESAESYSYVFDGQVGTLDYVLLSDSLYSKFEQAEIWHVNSDEADALDYNTDYGRSLTYYDGSTATRNSDHDPVLVGLRMDSAPVADPESLKLAFDAWIADGTLSGAGENPLAQIDRVGYFSRLLAHIVDLNSEGRLNQACNKLAEADYRTDGMDTPRDTLEGVNVAALNTIINEVITGLSCN